MPKLVCFKVLLFKSMKNVQTITLFDSALGRLQLRCLLVGDSVFGGWLCVPQLAARATTLRSIRRQKQLECSEQRWHTQCALVQSDCEQQNWNHWQ